MKRPPNGQAGIPETVSQKIRERAAHSGGQRLGRCSVCPARWASAVLVMDSRVLAFALAIFACAAQPVAAQVPPATIHP